MRRRQLIELHDLPWYPDLLREAQVEILDQANHFVGLAKVLADPFSALLDETGAEAVLDLCSGAGGPVIQLGQELEARGRPAPRVILSDLYPKLDAWQDLSEAHRWVDFSAAPVDATALPDELEGQVVTIINGLHHFPLEQVQKIFGSVIERGASIFVGEGFPRSVLRATAYLPSLALALPTALARTQRRRGAKFAASLTVLPPLGLWDWLVSALRIHEPAELAALGRAMAPDYRWTQGELRLALWGRAGYLSGIAP